MLKLTLKPGEYIDIGENIRIVFSGGSANNIHLLVDAPRELNVARSSAGTAKKKSEYYREKPISDEARKEIAGILMREKHAAAKAVPEKGKSAREQSKQKIYTVNNRR